jgi:hypothetical protein
VTYGRGKSQRVVHVTVDHNASELGIPIHIFSSGDMDTRGFSQVGRYGTISLMKRNDEHTVVTSFGIDTEELTFGRATTCGVRLYYPDVAHLHCKVVFEERKVNISFIYDQ